MRRHSRRFFRVMTLLAALLLATAALPRAALGASYTFWYSVNRMVDNQYASAYVSWNIFKIDGSSSHVFVEVVGSVQKKGVYHLLRFEPWMKRSAGSTTLSAWTPNAWKASGDNQTINFSLSWNGATVSTSFTGYTEGYQPYFPTSFSHQYSAEWRGVRTNTNTIGNNAIMRWTNFSSSNVSFGICGRSLYYAIRTEYQWGDCSNRAR